MKKIVRASFSFKLFFKGLSLSLVNTKMLSIQYSTFLTSHKLFIRPKKIWVKNMLSLQNSYISHVSHVAHIIIVTWLQFLMYGSSMCFHRDLSFHFLLSLHHLRQKRMRENVCYILTRFFEYSNFLLHPRTNKF